MSLSTYNKALWAGGAGAVAGMAVPWVLSLLHFIQPLVAGVIPGAGLVIGFIIAVVTALAPKNAAPKSSPS